MKDLDSFKQQGDVILYRTDDGKAQVQLRAMDGSVWLSQIEIAELFATTKQNVSLHAKNILEEGELTPEATVKDSLTVQTEGERRVRRSTLFYSLPMILAIGYRVRSPRGTQFRQWATGHLAEYLVKGFVMDDDKNAQIFFAEVQNKILFAVARQTAAEIVVSRADPGSPTWPSPPGAARGCASRMSSSPRTTSAPMRWTP